MLSTVKTNRYALIKSQRIAVAEAVQVTQTLCGLHAKAVFDDLLAPTNHLSLLENKHGHVDSYA